MIDTQGETLDDQSESGCDESPASDGENEWLIIMIAMNNILAISFYLAVKTQKQRKSSKMLAYLH